MNISGSVKKFNTMCKETLQFPDFANLFRGGFSYASRLEAIFDLFATELQWTCRPEHLWEPVNHIDTLHKTNSFSSNNGSPSPRITFEPKHPQEKTGWLEHGIAEFGKSSARYYFIICISCKLSLYLKRFKTFNALWKSILY